MDMYTGKQLGESIRIAIDRKLAQGVRKKDIAAHFQIKEPPARSSKKIGDAY